MTASWPTRTTSARTIVDRLRTITIALLTPFFSSLHAGLLTSFARPVTGIGTIIALFAVEIVTKVVAVWPAAGGFGMNGGIPPTQRC